MTLALVALLGLVDIHVGQRLDAWRRVTVYDVVPEACRTTVRNNNVGNVAGDMYFSTKDKYLPMACPVCSESSRGCRSPATFDCYNAESMGNLVVRQIEVDVFGDWGKAYNLCDVWHEKKHSCDYQCFSPGGRTSPGVGRQVVCGGSECEMGPEPFFGHKKPWDYWNYNLARLLGNTGQGEWYSLLAADEGTYWRNATLVKVISGGCHAKGLDTLVAVTGQECFDACTQPTNQSSACWINCFYTTILGPGANQSLTPPGAMDVDELARAWLSGFHSDDASQGGCQPCPESGPCRFSAEGAASVRAAPRAYAPA